MPPPPPTPICLIFRAATQIQTHVNHAYCWLISSNGVDCLIITCNSALAGYGLILTSD